MFEKSRTRICVPGSVAFLRANHELKPSRKYTQNRGTPWDYDERSGVSKRCLTCQDV